MSVNAEIIRFKKRSFLPNDRLIGEGESLAAPRESAGESTHHNSSCDSKDDC